MTCDRCKSAGLVWYTTIAGQGFTLCVACRPAWRRWAMRQIPAGARVIEDHRL